jgi:3',5'-cyclic AMP phosphodiesterase CpdA
LAGPILRFSDYETDTILEHTSVLQARSRVWWGWWKKRHEDYPVDALRQMWERVEGGLQLRIGLVDRADRRCFIASCRGVRFDNGGQALPTPEPPCTPAYYRDRSCPAWFMLTGITPVSQTDWTAEFGPIPVGDETLFPEHQSGGVRKPQRYKSSGVGILHLSDLHFGTQFGFSQISHSSVARLDDILARSCQPKPAAVVVSGDITSDGEHHGFVAARAFLMRLLEKLDLSVASLVIVPGNHDIIVDELNPTRDFEIEQEYRDFLSLLYNRDMELERIQWIRDAAGADYVFSLVNSSRPFIRSAVRYGYVGSDRSEPVLRVAGEIVNSLAGQPAVSVLVLHHHVVPPPRLEDPELERPVALALDSGELITLCQRNGIDAILHGHQHIPFIGLTQRVAECGALSPDGPIAGLRNVWVLGAGSTGVSAAYLGDEMRYNSFGRYVFDEGKLVTSVFEFSPAMAPRVKWKVDLALSR